MILMHTVFGPNVTPENLAAFIFGVLSVCSIPFSMIFYISNVFRNRTVARNQRAFWVILLFCGHIAVFPFYWYHHIWKDIDVERAPGQAVAPPVTGYVEERVAEKKSLSYKLIVLFLNLLPLIFGTSSVLLLIYGSDSNAYYVLAIIAFVALICATGFTIVEMYRDKRVVRNLRALWAIVLVAGFPLSLLIYWYLYIWRDIKRELQTSLE